MSSPWRPWEAYYESVILRPGPRRIEFRFDEAYRLTTMADTPKSLIKWRDDVAEHDFQAAQRYLSLSLGDDSASSIVTRLLHAEVTSRRANDILRATGLTPLPLTDPGVLRDLKKVLAGEKLSPVLVANADIADGYHRVSLAYALDPFADVPLRMEGSHR